MRTVLTHFFNEAYLLPWWLAHHVPMFDHGVLIDYASTDRSVAICREMAPHWRVVSSRNAEFSALAVDFEVMQYESELAGWKVALNVTEFLVCDDLSRLEDGIVQTGLEGAWVPASVMVDPFPDSPPRHDRALPMQKPFGFAETEHDFTRLYGHRARLYHRAAIGAYIAGRHRTQIPSLPTSVLAPYPARVLWYGYSPWSKETLDRKLQIQTRIPVPDKVARFGAQHLVDLAQLEAWRAELLPVTRVLALDTAVRPGRNIALGARASISSSFEAENLGPELAVDGVLKGGPAFHTAEEDQPWFTIDFERTAVFDEIVVFNRLDCSERARHLQVLRSDDGEEWVLVHAHDGTVFGGADGNPLRIACPRMSARYLRFQLPERGYLHLDQVEVYDFEALPGRAGDDGDGGCSALPDGVGAG